jgi:FKBP-type peptidyl-prolyl cis-trans isomerase
LAPATEQQPAGIEMNYLRIVTASTLVASAALAQEKLDLADPKVRVSYAIGMDIGKSMKRQSLELDPSALAAGVAEGFGEKARLTDAESEKAMNDFKSILLQKRQAAATAAGAENVKKGKAFLDANAKKDGVKTTASGLQYRILKSGPEGGKSPKSTDTVKVHYHGTLIDGAVFDSSVQRNDPATFPLNGVIPGWTEGVQLMKIGDKYEFVIPPELAYGEQGSPGAIGPNATLVFEVELLSIETSR